MSAFSNSAVMESLPGAFLLCSPFIAALTSPGVGSLTAISSVMLLTSLPWSLVIGFASFLNHFLKVFCPS